MGGHDWVKKRGSEVVESKRSQDMLINSLERQQHVIKIKGRSRDETSGCHQGAQWDKIDPNVKRETPTGDPRIIQRVREKGCLQLTHCLPAQQ